LFCAFVIGCLIGGCVTNNYWKNESVYDGKAEYYVNSTNLNKEWRWK